MSTLVVVIEHLYSTRSRVNYLDVISALANIMPNIVNDSSSMI